MNQAMRISCTFHIEKKAKGRKTVAEGEAALPACEPVRVPRVAKLLALAHRFEGLVLEGVVKDYAELARLGEVTRARMSQIMSLLNLAPDLQEAILFLPRTLRGRDPIQMHDLLPIATTTDWKRQRWMWQRLLDGTQRTAVLTPYHDFFKARGLLLPSAAQADRLDYDRLKDVFMSPDSGTPRELIDALYLVDEMATDTGMADLIAAAKAASVTLETGDEHSPADVAVQVWQRAPELLERKHAELYRTRPRSFEYFQTDEPLPPPFRMPNRDTINALQEALDDWFEEHKRGRNSRVFVYADDQPVWFMVRHGEPFKREESLVGEEPASVAFRPLKYDVLVYDAEQGELRVNAQLLGEKELYRNQFGLHLFGRPNFFPKNAKYTLEPIRRDGVNCLVCSDIEGLEWVRLREVHLDWDGPHGEYEIRRASNLFEAMKVRGNRAIPQLPRLARAVFLVKFRDAKRARSVTIRTPNVALYTRDEDSVRVEAWLHQRGFLTVRAEGKATDSVLDSA